MYKVILVGLLLVAAGGVAVFGLGADKDKKPQPVAVEKAEAVPAAERTETMQDEIHGAATGDDLLANAKDKLTPEQYNVCVMGGTEQPFNNKYYDHKGDGAYHCIVCDEPLFSSETKYDSGSGWPAFYAAVESGKIRELRDTTHGMVRTEVRCGNCDAPLGHLFYDGPSPTGMRYCINSASLDFKDGEGETPAENE